SVSMIVSPLALCVPVLPSAEQELDHCHAPRRRKLQTGRATASGRVLGGRVLGAGAAWPLGAAVAREVAAAASQRHCLATPLPRNATASQRLSILLEVERR